MRVLRAHKGWSQEGLASACGLHRTYIGGIERCEHNVSIDMVEKIATAFGVEVWRLVKADGTVASEVP
jgi:transcriptional regulator with XRE-family HTH domain